MTILLYFFIESFSMILMYWSEKFKSSFFIIILLLFLSFFICARDLSVGADYINYYEAMLRYASDNLTSDDEGWFSIGFRCLIFITSIFFESEKVPFIVTIFIAFFSLYFFIKAIRNFSINPVLSLFIFFCFCFYFQMMNQFRQMFAISVGFYSIQFINKSLAKYIIFILFATSFHTTAIVLLPMYWIAKITITKKIIFFYFIVIVLSYFFSSSFKSLILLTSYSKYINWSEFDVGMTLISFFNTVIRIIMLLLSLFFLPKIFRFKANNTFLLHYAFICTIIQMIALNANLFTRITTYFYVSYLFIIPLVLSSSKQINLKNFRLICIILFLTLLLYQIVYFCIQSKGSGYDHYQLIFG